MRASTCVLFVLLCAGCGGSSDNDGGAGSSGSSGSSGSGGSGASGGAGGSSAGGGAGVGGSSGSGGQGGDWTTLIEGSWQVSSGSEKYWCVTKTITEDVYVTAFRAAAPTGTHHTLLLYGEGGPDSEFPCGPTLQDSMLFASGVGSDDLAFPEGVAVKIPSGTQILLNLHLFNVGTSPISGVSGTLVQTIPAAEVQQEAEMILPGTMQILIPPNSEHSVNGSCEFPGNSTISTVWPHMHQYGSHMKVVLESGSGMTTLHDGPFAFGEQVNYFLSPPVAVAGGDTIHVECTFTNPTPQTITFGDSSESEMCFVGLYRYPKLSQSCQ
jgi:hypothetical protein